MALRVTTPAKPVRRYATVTAAAEYMACHPRTIRRMVADGLLTDYRLRFDPRIDLNELDALVESTKPVPYGSSRGPITGVTGRRP